MINQFYEKLAKLAVNYSLKVNKGDRVYVQGSAIAEELFRALYAEIIKAGGHPLLFPEIEGTSELFFKLASEEQLIYVDNVIKLFFTEFDCVIWISADYNTKKLSLIDPKLIAKSQGAPEKRELLKVFYDRAAKGDVRWIVLPFPSQSLAQEANMDLFS